MPPFPPCDVPPSPYTRRQRDPADDERETADDAVIHRRHSLQCSGNAEQHDIATAATGDDAMQEEKRERKKVERLQLQVNQVCEMVRAKSPCEPPKVGPDLGTHNRSHEEMHRQR